jgi:lantibiotic modifying enzyme
MSGASNGFLQAADSIGARLCRDAIWDGARCNWLGDSMEFVLNRWSVTHKSFGPDLYAGTAGIALFLAELFEFSGEPLFRRTAEGAIAQSLSRMEIFPPEARTGFYSGWIGIGWTLIETGQKLGRGDWVEKGLGALEEVSRGEPAAHELDVISGAAGSIPALLSVARNHRRPALVDAAARFGRFLLARANRGERGWSWTTMPGGRPDRDLTGYSHGTAGIGVALLELFNSTADPAFRQGAEEAFRYERHWYSAEHQNWPDLREWEPGKPAAYGMAWCHGAPGIGLSRLRAWELTHDDAYRREAEAALGSTSRTLQYSSPGQENFCLCHGLAGNAELLIYASEVFDNAAYRRLAEQVARRGIEMYANAGLAWPCGVMGGGESPNLLLGVAGIGHFLLRLHAPEKTPSVLILRPELPAQANS